MCATAIFFHNPHDLRLFKMLLSAIELPCCKNCNGEWAMSMQGLTIPKLPDILMPVPVVKSGEDVGKYIRLALMTAMLSVCFERIPGEFKPDNFHWFFSTAVLLGAVVTLAGTLSEKYSRIAVAAFCVVFLYDVAIAWSGQANHGWLAVWTIPIAIFFTKWWQQPLYADYLRITLGVVMLGAAAQKLLAGTYLDGSYIAYLSYFGTTTENMFRILCSEDTLNNPCGWHIFLGTFIVIWQIAVGLLLLAGVKSLIFLTVEVGFLLGAGLYADEMNFQVLNIALLCIAFRVGMSYSLFAVCGALLLIDMHGIGEFVNYVL
ncbi:hypothetical protein [Anderseniella sp. Alg231-50]|uniref:hypothetical protein n=1 Tax=Anderseniella sp. Alg231-50 TaxID=1922226 RepID=UPI00307C3F49